MNIQEQIETLEKIKTELVRWQHYEAAHHIREGIRALKKHIEEQKKLNPDSKTTVVLSTKEKVK